MSPPVPAASPPEADEVLIQTRNQGPSGSRPRLHAIDAIRGFCLLNIFVNHLSAGVLTRASPSNLGLSDSADLFVLLAGISAYLASGDRRFRETAARLWRRAGSLYLYNLVLIAVSLAGLVALSLVVGADVLLDGGVLQALAQADIATATWRLVTFQQSVGFSMVLRLYVALMLMAPALIWLARKDWWLPLPLVIAVWAIAAQFDLVARDSLTGVPLTLTILPWTLIFGIGVALGAALKREVSLPRSPWLLAGAVSVVVGYVVFLVIARAWPEGQAWLLARNDSFLLGASKTYQSPLRVLHTLSLVYIFMSCARAPVLRLVHQVAPDNVFARLGRRSAAVFMTGALIALPANELLNLAGRQWGAATLPALLVEVLFVAAGVALMIAVADSAPLKPSPAHGATSDLRIDPALAGPLPVRSSSRP
ncbi:OpgC domain-containing protein [Brevundimonas sp.]|uniref:OpgC domain-containing protein n=1 Tax=Brevundimonas sp. TaxID=1871086 RepID=UPI002FC5D42F